MSVYVWSKFLCAQYLSGRFVCDSVVRWVGRTGVYSSARDSIQNRFLLERASVEQQRFLGTQTHTYAHVGQRQCSFAKELCKDTSVSIPFLTNC